MVLILLNAEMAVKMIAKYTDIFVQFIDDQLLLSIESGIFETYFFSFLDVFLPGNVIGEIWVILLKHLHEMPVDKQTIQKSTLNFLISNPIC